MAGFFKAYDMRGTFGVDFDLETVRRVGAALPQVVPGRRWLVGRDGRTTSPDVSAALAEGLVSSGAEVTDLGLVTTPMVYFFTAEEDFDGSVMVTASHNPPADNGLKVSKRTAFPVGYANGLKTVEQRVRSSSPAAAESSPPFSPLPSQTSASRLETYSAWLADHALFDFASSGLRAAVDCSNGSASLLAHRLFPGAVFLNDTVDGTFPAHSPNPLLPEARAQLAACVRERALDCGVVFDGDADRCMFVDEKGDFVQPDYLIPIVARACARASGAARFSKAVLHDVRTSRGAIETLREDGFAPTMVPVGHAFAKPRMRAENALCGGELAGHYYFGVFHGCDSGALAALRILSEAARAKARGETFSQMMRPIVARYANSGEINFRVTDQDAAIARVLEAARAFGPETGRSDLDGVRVEFADGWFNVRKSNTEPYLRLVAEARTRETLARWCAALAAAAKDDDVLSQT